MRLKKDDNLAYIAKCANRPIEELSHNIVTTLWEHGAVCDDEENYGCRLIDCIESEFSIFGILDLLMAVTGLEDITCDMFKTICDCTIMGDGDCPECGGEMEYITGECHRTNVGQDEEPEYTMDSETFRCHACGYVNKYDYND